MGTIQTFGVEYVKFDCKLFAKYSSIGGLAGTNYGTIKNCYVTGDINCESSGTTVSVGKLVGNNYGTVENSFVNADLEFNGKSFLDENCQLRIGGIAGINEGHEYNSVIKNVYNIGKISITNGLNIPNSSSICLGGICGWNQTAISSSYSITNITCDSDEAVMYIGSAIGREQSSTKVSNNYYYDYKLEYHEGKNVAEVEKDVSVRKDSSDMKKSAFVELLNNGQEIWFEDTKNINDGYPILNWKNLLK